MARRLALLSLALPLAALSCSSTPRGSGPSPAVMLAIPAPTSEPSPAPPSPRVDLAAIEVDGIRLGTPISAVLARDPYRTPCDVDPIDHRRSTLYFWAAGPCRGGAPFPGKTSVVIITPPAPEGTPDDQGQPIELLCWAGGSFFDGKTTLPIRIGDTAQSARDALGPPTSEQPITDVVRPDADEPIPDLVLLSWQHRVHAIARDGRVVALGVGSLEGGDERRGVLVSTYAHHLRYARKAGP